MVGKLCGIFTCPCPTPSPAQQPTFPVWGRGPGFQRKKGSYYKQIIVFVCSILSRGLTGLTEGLTWGTHLYLGEKITVEKYNRPTKTWKEKLGKENTFFKMIG